MTKSRGGRSVRIGRDAREAIIVTGDRNTVTQALKRVSLPPPNSVNIKAELSALKIALARLDAPDALKIESILGNAEEELKKPAPNKVRIAKVLDQAIGYAKKAEGFATAAEKIIPHIVR